MQDNLDKETRTDEVQTEYKRIHSSVICQTTGPQPVIIISNLSDDRSTASSKTIPPLKAI
jgi:hypothetical protein